MISNKYAVKALDLSGKCVEGFYYLTSYGIEHRMFAIPTRPGALSVPNVRIDPDTVVRNTGYLWNNHSIFEHDVFRDDSAGELWILQVVEHEGCWSLQNIQGDIVGTLDGFTDTFPESYITGNCVLDKQLLSDYS